jgi:hypothetical protein
MQARYQNSSRGQFISEDLVFLSLGDSAKVKQLLDKDQRDLLADPQQLNSYSYASGNPISKSDPSGLGDAGLAQITMFWSFNPNIQVAAAKQQLGAQLQASYQGGVAAAKFSAAVVLSGVVSMIQPETVPYILNGWSSAAVQAYQDSQNGTFDKSGSSYAVSFGLGVGETPFLKSGSLPSLAAKSVGLSVGEQYFFQGIVSPRLVLANVAGALAGRAGAAAGNYAAGSTRNVLLTQLSETLTNLSAQLAVLQVASSQTKSSK